MKIFGTVQPFVESPETSYKIGRLVANYEFFSALFQFSDFDEFHIFCPTYSNCKLTQEKIAKENLPAESKSKIKIFHISSLKNAIANNNYHIFHLGGWGFFYPGFAHLRNIYAKHLFPITGITHSLNAKEATFHALKVCSAPILPFDSIVCTSSCGKKVLQNLFASAENNISNAKFKGRMDIIPLGIDDKFRNIPDRSESRKILGIDDNSFVILTLGRIEADNKMDFLPFLNTVKRFTNRNPGKKINLVIAGGCDKQGQQFIKELIIENQLQSITKLFLNFENDLKQHLYRSANVYAAPIDNFQETFGISVIEAMSQQCAVIASDFDGYSELIENDIDGIKIPTYWANITNEFHGVSEIMNFQTLQLLLSQSVAVDQDKMLDAFQKLIDNPEKCIQLGQSASKKAHKKFLWSKIIPQFCKLWDELAREAQNYKQQISKPENLFELDYWKVFSHYPSNLISEKNKICLTDFGKEALISGKIPAAYSDISASVIIPQLVSVMIKNINQSTISSGQFIEMMKKNADVTDSTAMYYILWMTKYNLMKIL